MIQDKVEKAPLAIYREHLAKGELAYQFSPSAGRAVFYPRLVCPVTGADDLEWRVSAGRGTIYATSVVSQRDAPDRRIVLVDLDEGFRMLSRVDEAPDAEVRIGARVRVRIAQSDPDWDGPYPTFELEETSR